MSQSLWEIIVTIYNFLKPLREADTRAGVATADLVELRSNLRNRLEYLRTEITGQHSERDAYFVLFPLVAHCDELVKKLILDISNLEWPPLQQELYQVADAGELFFELLDSVLGKPETLPLVYEVYYFCLNDGFCGRYSANPERLASYRQNLRKHILLQPVEAVPALATAKVRASFHIPDYVYYAGAGLLLLLVYSLLNFLGSRWQPMN